MERQVLSKGRGCQAEQIKTDGVWAGGTCYLRASEKVRVGHDLKEMKERAEWVAGELAFWKEGLECEDWREVCLRNSHCSGCGRLRADLVRLWKSLEVTGEF